jgi:hypothetical protein
MAFGWSIITEQKLKIAKPEGVSNSSKISSYSPHLKKRGEASPPCGLSFFKQKASARLYI